MDYIKQFFQLFKKGFEDIIKALKEKSTLKLEGLDIVALKGEPGKDGYTPRKKVDYFTDLEIEDIAQDILSRIKAVKIDKDGKKTVDVDYKKILEYIKQEVANIKLPDVIHGLPGKDAVVDYDFVIMRVLERVHVPDMKPFIREQIEKIFDEYQEKQSNRTRTFNSAGPTTRLEELTNVSTEGIEEGRSLVWRGGKWVPATSGGGFTVETPVGAINDVNKIFTVSSEPEYIVVDGTTYFDGAGYSYAALTITLNIAPSFFIRSFHSS